MGGPSAAHVVRARAMSEADLQGAVLEAAAYHGWLIHHDRPARTTRGWATAITGHAGFPDLVLAHPRHGLLLRELKTERGLLTAQQSAWLEALSAGGANTAVWRPTDWLGGVIDLELRGIRP